MKFLDSVAYLNWHCSFQFMGFSSKRISFLPDEVILMSREWNLISRANATLSSPRFLELRQGYKYTWLEFNMWTVWHICAGFHII